MLFLLVCNINLILKIYLLDTHRFKTNVFIPFPLAKSPYAEIQSDRYLRSSPGLEKFFFSSELFFFLPSEILKVGPCDFYGQIVKILSFIILML